MADGWKGRVVAVDGQGAILCSEIILYRSGHRACYWLSPWFS
jgi:hypothetical protein